jgi:hypothetical protein
MSEMIDRVALIIHDGIVSGDSSWDEMAAEAIKSMREPTKDMVRCGCGWGMGLSETEVTEGWRVMINQALR